mmetsp:Transcript_77376/g.218974  ORF Transcript_77376/g.218974 Transcript_77376/m.218974 type:complete len:240 (+) Transcript_77376:65-784(+)
MKSRWLTLRPLKHGQTATKAVELADGANVGDILKQVAALAQVPAKDIFITEDRWPLPGMTGTAYATCTVVGNTATPMGPATVPSSVTVKLLKSEAPQCEEILLGGVDDEFDDLPDIITVEAQFTRTNLERTEALELNDDLIMAYSDEEFQKKLTRLQDRIKDGKVDRKKYPRMLGDFTLEVQKKLIFPKWGFDSGPRGVMGMVRMLDQYKDDPEVNLKSTIARGLLGLEYAWLPSEESS